MALLHLPEEILIEIIKYLDFKSSYTLYNTCSDLKNIVAQRNVIKECDLSLSTLATGQSLKLKFFSEIANHVQVLNLKGVPDLNRSFMFPAVRKLKCLTLLDISFTSINLVDLLEIYKICPTLKCVGINFDFGKKLTIKIPQNILLQTQDMFQKFENVHFVLNVNNLNSDFPFYILQKSKLKSLKFTFTHCNLPVYQNKLCFELHTNMLNVCCLNWRYSLNLPISITNFAFLLKLNKYIYEFFLVSCLGYAYCTVVATNRFKDFFKKYFNIETISLTEVMMNPNLIYQNFVFMAWDSNTTNFDDTFFSNLVLRVRKLFPCQFNMSSKQLPAEHESFFTIVETNFDEIPEEPAEKRQRIAPKYIELNYDSVFDSHQSLKLTLKFEGCYKNPFGLSAHCNYLSKITFLSLNDLYKNCSNFYKILFECCVNLKTFVSRHCRDDLHLINSIYLSQSLNNLYLESYCLDYKKLFLSLGKCRSLENIFICDHSVLPVDLTGLQELIKSSAHLYNLQINSYLNKTTLKKSVQIANKTKLKYGKPYLNVVFDSVCYYDPFIDVFGLNTLKNI